MFMLSAPANSRTKRTNGARLNRWGAGAITCALALMVAGCAAPPMKHSALPEALAADQGVVSVKVIGVQPLSAFNAKWRTLKLTEVSTGRGAELRDTAPVSAGYSLFLGPLPPGQYSVSGFHSDGVAPGAFGVLPALIIMGMTSDSQSIGSQLGNFTVRPGTLTNLGVVVSALPEDKNASLKVAVMADEKGLTSTLEDVEPQSRARLKAMPASGWDHAPDPTASAKALDIVRGHARNVSAMEVLEGGRIAIGSALGMVHVRGTAGQWTSMSTGSLDNITSVRAMPGNGLFAGTDSGRYHVWNAEQGIWRSHEAAIGERVVSMERLGEAGYAILTQSLQASSIGLAGRNRVILKKELNSPEPPNTLLDLEGGSATGRLPMFFDGKSLLVVFNHVGFSRTGDVYRVDPATLQHKLEKVDHWTQGFYRLGDGLLVRERMNGLSLYSDFSLDGVAWSRNEASGPIAMHFSNRERGYGVAVTSTGWSGVTLALNKTVDGGKLWTKVGTPVEATGAATVRVVGDTVFVFTGKQLLSTRDDGSTWVVEWPRAAM
jgi:hypothetical protein